VWSMACPIKKVTLCVQLTHHYLLLWLIALSIDILFTFILHIINFCMGSWSLLPSLQGDFIGAKE